MIIDLEKQKKKRAEKARYACPECRKKGEFCPEWIFDIDDEQFEDLHLNARLEWLKHTRSFS